MKLQRGDVVLLDFPYSDGTGGKVRPAVVFFEMPVRPSDHALR